MACKITHRSLRDQQIRFANRDAAERYAEIMGGGVENWVFTTVPSVVAEYGWGPYPERAPHVLQHGSTAHVTGRRRKVVLAG
ncbi:hypothetical protein BJF85_07345 [Saccharomonospora sp. CUA-673]|uniref:hypothetical protein n=1 Tax=Saccharomonospora sp. CUA-673 TaxID=1904969 RepID=UPI000968453B|nr:hypothetical protein [Saccharomonospora sp. CUA-673]OLT39030.1 hypothetical protein BJF85_07345 [Saccharomonospora sp. CUA-673]